MPGVKVVRRRPAHSRPLDTLDQTRQAAAHVAHHREVGGLHQRARQLGEVGVPVLRDVSLGRQVEGEVCPAARHAVHHLQVTCFIVEVDVVDVGAVEVHPVGGEGADIETFARLEVAGRALEIAGLYGNILIGQSPHVLDPLVGVLRVEENDETGAGLVVHLLPPLHQVRQLQCRLTCQQSGVGALTIDFETHGIVQDCF